MPLLAAWLLSQANPTLRMEITFAGAKAGESTYERRADGTFRSTTRLKIGPTEIDSTVEGKMEAGRIVRYKAVARQGAVTVTMDYKPGKLAYDRSGQKGELPYTVPAAYAGNLHPQFTARLLAGYRGLKPGESRKAPVYLVDAGLEAPVEVKALPDAQVRAEGRDETVRRFGLTIGTTEIEYGLSAKGDVVSVDVPSQRLRFVLAGWEGLYDEGGKHPELSQPTFGAERLKGLRMRTRDGVALVADATRPAGGGRFPAILERTPYGREASMVLADWWAARGYVYVAQDCRGRGDSDGAWDPFVNEGRDGFDAVEWVARQPWCDGKVGMVGGSYAGVAQWQAAVERPPSLRCIVPQVSPPDAMRNLPYEYGTFYLYGSLWWSRIVAGKQADLGAVAQALPNPQGLAKLPLKDVDRAVFGKPSPIYQSWLRRTTLRDWKGFDHLDRLGDAQVPALHVSGWYDGDGIGTKLNWEAMRRAGRTDQWLVYGPWTHAFNTTTRLGDEDFGPAARFDLDGLTLRFFDTYLKGRSVRMEDEPRVRAFVTGANRWVSLDGWPASTTPLETLYLAPGALKAGPGAPGAAVYTYDPAKDASVSLGGESTLRMKALPRKGTYALFQSAPFGKPTAIGGPFEVRLFFKSGARDTDFFAGLLDVAPDGTRRVLGIPGKLRASYRESLTRPSLLVPGRHYTALLRPWDAAHEFGRGHRLALLVTSSAFPAYARNPGTGERLATATRTVPQRNAILTGTVTPSRITFRRLW